MVSHLLRHGSVPRSVFATRRIDHDHGRCGCNAPIRRFRPGRPVVEFIYGRLPATSLAEDGTGHIGQPSRTKSLIYTGWSPLNSARRFDDATSVITQALLLAVNQSRSVNYLYTDAIEYSRLVDVEKPLLYHSPALLLLLRTAWCCAVPTRYHRDENQERRPDGPLRTRCDKPSPELGPVEGSLDPLLHDHERHLFASLIRREPT